MATALSKHEEEGAGLAVETGHGHLNPETVTQGIHTVVIVTCRAIVQVAGETVIAKDAEVAPPQRQDLAELAHVVVACPAAVEHRATLSTSPATERDQGRDHLAVAPTGMDEILVEGEATGTPAAPGLALHRPIDARLLPSDDGTQFPGHVLPNDEDDPLQDRTHRDQEAHLHPAVEAADAALVDHLQEIGIHDIEAVFRGIQMMKMDRKVAVM